MTNNAKNIIAGSIFSVLALALAVSFFSATLPSVAQMKHFIQEYNDAVTGDTDPLFADKTLFSPNAFSQGEIRSTFLDLTFGRYRNGEVTGSNTLFDGAVAEMQAYVAIDQYHYVYFLSLAKAYDQEAVVKNDPSYYAKAEMMYQKALALSPNRQDIEYAYATHLSNSGNPDKAIALMRTVLAENPQLDESNYYLGLLLAKEGASHYDEALGYLEYAFNHQRNMAPSADTTKSLYEQFFAYYYGKKDVTDLRIVASRLVSYEPSQQAQTLQTVISYIDANHAIPVITITAPAK